MISVDGPLKYCKAGNFCEQEIFFMLQNCPVPILQRTTEKQSGSIIPSLDNNGSI